MAKKSKTKKGTKGKKNTGVYAVDFSKAQGGGANKRYPEADYRVKYIKWEDVHKKDEPDEKGVKVTFQFLEGKYKGQTFFDRLWLQDNTLWRIRAFLEAMDVEVPNKRANVNFEKYLGKELGVTLVDNEYNGRVSSQVGDYIDLDTLAGADEEDEDEDEDEEEEDEDDDDDEDEDEDEDEEEELEEMDVDEDL